MLLRRVLLVLSLTAALIPVAVAVAATRGASSPTAAARLHYRHIALGEYRAAYDLLTSAAKKRLGPYARWKAGYAQTGQVAVSGLKRSKRIATFKLTACRGQAGREVTILETFTVRWPTRKVAGRWFLDQGARVTRTSKVEVARCQLALP